MLSFNFKSLDFLDIIALCQSNGGMVTQNRHHTKEKYIRDMYIESNVMI